jgi:hypothetical protein
MAKKDEQKQLKVEITEMFCAQIDGDRMYTGCIKRLRDASGNPVVFSRIVMPNGLLCAREVNQEALGINLDIMAKDIVDGNLHGDCGKSTEIIGSKYFLN